MSASLVVLTDFLAVSNCALSYAATLAVPLHAHLVLLHLRHDGLLSPDEYSRQHTPQGEKQLEQVLGKLVHSLAVPAEVEISEEFLPDAVTDTVHHHHPLMLVLGRPGTATTPTELISVTVMDLLRTAPYPLLIVPTMGWEVQPPTHLLLAVDGQEFTLGRHAGVVDKLRAAFGARLSVAHITNPTDPQPPMSRETVWSVCASGLASDLTSTDVHELKYPSVAEGILQAGHELRADMLVLIARRHSLLGSLFHRSVTAQVIRESQLPILVLPSPD